MAESWCLSSIREIVQVHPGREEHPGQGSRARPPTLLPSPAFVRSKLAFTSNTIPRLTPYFLPPAFESATHSSALSLGSFHAAGPRPSQGPGKHRSLLSVNMAAFVGLSVAVTLQNPRGAVLVGVVSGVDSQTSTLTLQDGMLLNIVFSSPVQLIRA